ncbi:hypothetical protein AB205_0148920 [Aquarana catesbeiana]|uniref:Uncharacterized protein n=1 Tax=Aquarana catesbeiana TaxID=8400 RepID=A0A2G9RIU3_AQUCT|nr:hypothetical protein AB205_0148920 [Aquarana catesbeiana]
MGLGGDPGAPPPIPLITPYTAPAPPIHGRSEWHLSFPPDACSFFLHRSPMICQAGDRGDPDPPLYNGYRQRSLLYPLTADHCNRKCYNVSDCHFTNECNLYTDSIHSCKMLQRKRVSSVPFSVSKKEIWVSV